MVPKAFCILSDSATSSPSPGHNACGKTEGEQEGRKAGTKAGKKEGRKGKKEKWTKEGRLLTEEADTLNSSGAILAGEGITYSANREMYPYLSLHSAVIWTQEARGERGATEKHHFTLKLWVCFWGIKGSQGTSKTHLFCYQILLAVPCCHCTIICLSWTGRETRTKHLMLPTDNSILYVCIGAASCSCTLGSY